MVRRMINVLEEKALAYEQGKMMRDDSEVEINLSTDADGKQSICIADYSEERGGAEIVESVCPADDINTDEIIDLCNEHHWCYCI